jgi:hypothetical protein
MRAFSDIPLFMKKACFHGLRVGFLVWGVAGLALTASAQFETFGGNPNSSAFIRIPSDTDDWTRHFRIGAMVGMNISASFSANGTFGVNHPSGVYDDGYVHEDQWSAEDGHTTYWGYDKASQYNAANQTVTMTSTSMFSTDNSSKTGGGMFPGFDLAYGDNLWYWKHARVGWELGFGLLPISLTSRNSTAVSGTQTNYVFSTGGTIIPQAPYYGNPGGSSAMISDTYTATTNSYTGTISGSQTLEVMLYTLRLGPTFYWDLTDSVGMSLGAGPAIGIVSGDYKYNETITIDNSAGNTTHNTGQIDGTDVVFGGYVNATVLYHVQDNADIYLGAQYMSMGDATISGGGRVGKLNLGGQLYFTVGINWPF